MINKWKAKIIQRGLYNRRDPPWRGGPGIKRESTIAISRTPVTILIQYLLEQNSSDCAKNKLSLINSVHLCLIVMNTILTIIHALKSSSLTHSLQIYYTELTSPRSHTPWVWAAKRVLTIKKRYVSLSWQVQYNKKKNKEIITVNPPVIRPVFTLPTHDSIIYTLPT